MSSRIREALADLEQDVAPLRLDPPQAVRARGEARRRRQAIGVAAAAVAGVAVAGAVALPVLHPADRQGGQPLGVGAQPSAAQPSASCTAVRPSQAPVKSPPGASDAALAGSRKATVFLTSASSSAEKAAIEVKLRSLKGIAAIDFEDHERAWQRFTAQFCYAPDLVGATKPESLPESFHLTLVKPADYAMVQGVIAEMPGVAEVLRSPE
jgi:hypothetical protein